MIHNNLISSRISPICMKGLRKYAKSSYSGMLIDDLSRSFKISLSQKPYSEGFYSVHPSKDRLELLLSFRDRWTDYDYDRLLCAILHDLIINGKAYAEIITWKRHNTENDTEEYMGLSIEPIHVKCAKHIGRRYCFKGSNLKGEAVSFIINAKHIICFDLKDLGLTRNYFRKLFRRLQSIDIQNAANLVIDKTVEKRYDFREHVKKNELKLLQYTHSLYWYGRNMSNQHLSESYRLYREIHLKLLKQTILDYLLKQINNALSNFKTELGFEGIIVAKQLAYDYEAEFKKYYTGELNAEQLAQIIYC